jgi:hypothetical protein
MQTTAQDNLVISYHRMRMIVGILGISLPFSLLIGNFVINNFNLLNNDFLTKNCYGLYQSTGDFKDSISDYYYSAVGELFVGTLCAVSFFMFCYRGYKKRAGEFFPSDNFMVNSAGICALGVAIFPTTNDCVSDNLRTFISSRQVGYIHYSFAILFFISLAIISLVNFRRTALISNFGKMPSHKYYKFCGFGILFSILLIPLFSFTGLKNIQFFQDIHIVFVLESFALLFFGTSWIIKGRVDNN